MGAPVLHSSSLWPLAANIRLGSLSLFELYVMDKSVSVVTLNNVVHLKMKKVRNKYLFLNFSCNN
jgi:hypothetical protein